MQIIYKYNTTTAACVVVAVHESCRSLLTTS